MYTLLCTTYNTQKDGSLQLRNNWSDEIPFDAELSERLKNYNISMVNKFPHKAGDISEILEGEFDLPDTVIHLRIVKTH
jgi:hypothetical protein